jgi:membrane protein
MSITSPLPPVKSSPPAGLRPDGNLQAISIPDKTPGNQPMGLVRYLAQTEVHTYAFSVAANAILSLFPFIVMMFTIARDVFHSRAMESVIGEMIRYFLPAGQDFVVKNMAIVAHARKGVKLASLVMLLISSTGVFMPLECALNRVWGVSKNRSYLMNQLVAFGLAVSIGTLAMISIVLTAAQHSILRLLFFGHTQNLFYRLGAHWVLQISAAIASILLFFLIYWILPNRRVPARAVLPTAIVVGLLWELAKMVYVLSLPWLNFQAVYGPFSISVSLMMWAFLTGLLLLAGAHYSASRYAIHLTNQAKAERAKA